MKPLLSEDGENEAVRAFLMRYGKSDDETLTVGSMRNHLRMCGFPDCWPEWATREPDNEHLNKAMAQDWLRYLFALEKQS